MKDSFNREINYLRISLTNSCNLNCAYCRDDNSCSKSNLMTPERIGEIVSSCSKIGITKVRLSGGEPLLREDIIQICQVISNIKEIKQLSITTNGILLDKYAKQLYENGVASINVSLDTLKADKYFKMSHGNLDDVLKGINVAKEIGIKIKINCVLIANFNDDEVHDLISFANANGYEIRFIELMPIGNGNKFQYMSNNEIIAKNNNLIKIKEENIADIYQDKISNEKVSFISPLSNSFCHKCSRLRLTYDGFLKPCLHSDEEIDLNNLHDEQLLNAIKKAILAKPKNHHLNKEKSFCKRPMIDIGG